MGFRPLGVNLLKKFHNSSARSIPPSFAHKKPVYPLIPRLYDRSPPYPENHSLKISKRWHVGHSHHHHEQTSEEGERIFRLGLLSDIGLTAGKVLTGYLSGSTAIIADAAHSLSDVVIFKFSNYHCLLCSDFHVHIIMRWAKSISILLQQVEDTPNMIRFWHLL